MAAAAYACLTYVEKEFARGERDAAAKLAISRNVLSAIRQLASTVGDDTTARKFNRQPRRAHTPTEVTFLEAAVTALIRRLGELASGGSAAALPQLGMNDLPKL